jgi:hypothetical protein
MKTIRADYTFFYDAKKIAIIAPGHG